MCRPCSFFPICLALCVLSLGTPLGAASGLNHHSTDSDLSAQNLDVPLTQNKNDDFRLSGRDFFNYYVPDYALTLASTLTFLSLFPHESREAKFGPTLDDVRANRNLSSIQNPIRPDTIPVWTEGVVLIAAGLGSGIAVSYGDENPWLNAHASLLGFAETLMTTLATTEALKLGVGRLRPDYLARLNLYGPDSYELRYGQKSFVSGHTSLAFAAANYLSMSLGGRFLWGQRAKTSPLWQKLSVGAFAASTWAFAIATGWTRVSDNRHFTTDVIGGALLGSVIAQAIYWRHNGANGRLRILPNTYIDPEGGTALGLSVSGTF